MSFEIEPLHRDDFDQFVRVWYDAFEPESVDQVLPMIYPEGLSPQLNERLRNRIFKATDGDLGEFCFVARDIDSRKIIGVSWWTALEKPSQRPDAALSKQSLQAQLEAKNADPTVPGTNQAIGDAFYTALFEAEQETIKAKGVPYITLQVLGVLPEYARQGAGSMLLEHGLTRLDKLNVWTFLLAASTGKGLYEKYGFETVSKLDFDGRKYGGRSHGEHWTMWRPAQDAST